MDHDLSDDQLEAALAQEIADLQWHVRPRWPAGNRKVRIYPTFSLCMDVLADALTAAGNPWSPEDVAQEFQHCRDVGGLPPDLRRTPQFIERLRRGELVPNKLLRIAFLNGDRSLNDVGLSCGWLRTCRVVADTSRVARALGLRPTTGTTKNGQKFERATVRIWVPALDAQKLADALDLMPVEVGI